MPRFLLVCFWCYFCSVGRLPRQRAEARVQGDEWDWDARCEIHKTLILERLKKKKKKKVRLCSGHIRVCGTGPQRVCVLPR